MLATRRCIGFVYASPYTCMSPPFTVVNGKINIAYPASISEAGVTCPLPGLYALALGITLECSSHVHIGFC